MRLEARKYLYDIQQAAMLVARATAGQEFEEVYRQGEDAVQRNAEVEVLRYAA